MKETPIIFSTEMVRAILDGRKSQTRRVINPQPTDQNNLCANNSGTIFIGSVNYGQISEGPWHIIQCPYGKPGDLLYVREKFRLFNSWDECSHYDDCSCSRNNGMPVYYADTLDDENKWKPSIHMPKKYARIWLKVKNIRVELVQDISFDDMKEEGCLPKAICGGNPDNLRLEYWKPLWDSINKKRGYGWDVNPFVWVIEFEKYNYANNQ